MKNMKDFVPPVVIRLLKQLTGLETTREYDNYADAIKKCSTFSYGNSEFCDMLADKTDAFHHEFKLKPYNLRQSDSCLLAAINLYMNVHSKKNLKILDFGGACGYHFFTIKRFFNSDFYLKWYVVETDEMVKSAINKGLNNDELIFVNSIDEVGDHIDLVHSSGALQCVPMPYEFLDKLIRQKAPWMLFNRMILTERDKDILTIVKSFQSTNGPGKLPPGYSDRIVSYPHTTLSFGKFNEIMNLGGYSLEWDFLDSSTGIQLKNEKIAGRSLLYKQEKYA